jgi:small conductance mechanosensitive channel
MIWQKLIRYFLLLLTTLVMTLNLSHLSLAQLPFQSYIPNPNLESSLPETPAWDLKKAKPCGKYWCSSINFSGNRIFSQDFITIALSRNLNKPSQEVIFDVEERAKFVQNIFQEILDKIQKSNQLGNVEPQNWQFWLLNHQKPIHPLTPIVVEGKENEQTVIFVAAKSELGLPQQTIITVTQIDAKANGITQDKLVQKWRWEIKKSLSEAIWGMEMDVQQPFLRLKIISVVIFATLILIFVFARIKLIIKKWKKNLSLELTELQTSLAINPELQTSEPPEIPRDDLDHSNSSPNDSLMERLVVRSIDQSRKVIADGISFSTKLLPSKLREKQNLIRQQINISELLIMLLRLAQFTLIFIAIASIVFTYRETRFLFNLFFTQAILLPIIWILAGLLDKIVDFWIDYALDKWAKQRQEMYPNSNRPSLRVNTYSLALRNATTVLFTAIAIFLSLAVIGVSPTAIASAGVLAVVFAFLSRNLLEDMLNGILILATDRYAVGDVIEINGLSGCVESMNLYTTSLRNLDGQLTVIPNGKISTVVNMTKNWSQVNFTIEVGWNNNLSTVMMILQQVADQMYAEPEWAEKMIASAKILGVERLSHEGIVLRLIIPTQPSQHWDVARQYRLRVKEAFDSANINIGIPQREIWYQYRSPDEDQLSSV